MARGALEEEGESSSVVASLLQTTVGISTSIDGGESQILWKAGWRVQVEIGRRSVIRRNHGFIPSGLVTVKAVPCGLSFDLSLTGGQHRSAGKRSPGSPVAWTREG